MKAAALDVYRFLFYAINLHFSSYSCYSNLLYENVLQCFSMLVLALLVYAVYALILWTLFCKLRDVSVTFVVNTSPRCNIYFIIFY